MEIQIEFLIIIASQKFPVIANGQPIDLGVEHFRK
jgi:hypothetical protein